MKNREHWSRLAGFFNLGLPERRTVLSKLPLSFSEEDFSILDKGLLLSDADRMSENVIATFGLPLSVAVNFIVDHEPVLVPMVTEEPSIVAACSKMAKLVAHNGGFFTTVGRSIMKGQIQIYGLRDIDRAISDFKTHKEELVLDAKQLCARMEERGGGLIDIGLRVLPSAAIGPMVIIEPMIDVVDAMGANVVNSVVERLSQKLVAIFDGKLGLRILSNLCDQRMARAHCELSVSSLSSDVHRDDGMDMAERLIAAHAFAEADVYRACTHNKGILNGIDAVAIATGNDFRAIEAGAHAYAALNGSYRPLTSLSLDKVKCLLVAELALPLSVGVVGGLAKFHGGVQRSHKLLGRFSKTAQGLSSVMVSAGLSQCLAALLAMTQEGIQKGHMKLHHRKKIENIGHNPPLTESL